MCDRWSIFKGEPLSCTRVRSCVRRVPRCEIVHDFSVVSILPMPMDGTDDEKRKYGEECGDLHSRMFGSDRRVGADLLEI